ncbi:MAG: glycosyltransferase family A protein [Simkaniaceae bacterium]
MSRRNRSRFQRFITLFILVAIPSLLIKEGHKIMTSKKNLSFKEVRVAYVENEKEFQDFVVIIVPTAKNQPYWERNLDSIFNQQYDHFRVIYMDDGLDQELYQRVKSYIEAHDKHHIVRLLPFEDKRSLFDRYIEVVNASKDDEIIVHFDGNDWFAHDKVLEKLNEAYEQKGVWLTYGQYLEYPSYKKGSEKALNRRLYTDKRFEKIPWMTSSFKTYYAKLFKELNFEELSDRSEVNGENLWNFMLPMVKISRCHIHYIPEVLYVHNVVETKKE